ncbi:hypothetical protein [Desulfocicer vacuolatum]|nr:hypothetical protein [Desulfocicer vacuolatum]
MKQKFMGLPFEDLMEKADNFLASGKPRDAIKVYKIAIKASKSSEQLKVVHNNLFMAYLERVKELTEKNMLVEAKALEKQSLTYLPAPELMNRTGMIAFLEMSDIREIFEYVVKYLKCQGDDRIVSAMIADAILLNNAWHFLEKTDDAGGLSRDASIVKSSVPLMDKGHWEKAAQSMKTLPRTSPFAHIRMFCRAMALFAAGDDKKMIKAISFIPGQSVFRKIADTLETTVQCVEEKRMIQGDQSLVGCLWEGPLTVWETADEIIKQLEKKKFDKKTKQLIRDFSTAVLPDNPEYARQYILETLWQQNISDERKFIALEKSLLPEKADLISAKRGIVFPENALLNTVKYLDCLKKSGVDAHLLALTESLIIFSLCDYIQGGSESAVLNEASEKVTKRFGISSNDDFDLRFMQFVAHGIKCDPKNRPLYELSANLKSHSRKLKNLKEQLLLSMCEVYPEDPYPCIELASLYHSKNAFRKAENILKKAMEIAPYDSRVQDQHLISLIISADKGVNKSNFHLVWKDFEKAQKLDTGNNVILLREKELFYKICEKPEIPEKIIRMHLDELSSVERLKIISMLRMDAENKPKQGRAKILRKVQSLLEKELKHISTLSSMEIIQILKPFPREWKYVFKSLRVDSLFFESMDHILKYLDDNDLIKLTDQILIPDNFEFFQEAFYMRTQEGRFEDGLILFYSLVLDGLVEDDWDIDAFIDLLDDVDAETRKKIHEAGNRLSRYTHGPYKHALQTLNFGFLDDMFSGPWLDDDDDDDDFMDDDFNPFDLLGGGMPEPDDPMVRSAMLDMAKSLKKRDPDAFNNMFEEIRTGIEGFLDENEIRGLPKFLLKNFRPVLEEAGMFDIPLLLLKTFFLKEAKEQFSREAKIIFLD